MNASSGPSTSTGESWEAKLWFGDREPAYLTHNLYEDEVAAAALIVPQPLFCLPQQIAVRIERFYEGLDFAALPRACFEDPAEIGALDCDARNV